VAAQPPGLVPLVPLKSKAAIQGYSFTSVSVPPTILLVFLIPHLQLPDAVVVGSEMGVLPLLLVVAALLSPDNNNGKNQSDLTTAATGDCFGRTASAAATGGCCG